MFWLIAPIGGAAILGGLAFYRKVIAKKGILTPDRERVYVEALTSIKDADRLLQLAKAFRAEGLPAQADMLEKRARLRTLPPEIKAERDKIFREALKSKDPKEVQRIAASFEGEGASGAALRLREYADSLPDEPSEIEPDSKVESEPITEIESDGVTL